MTTETSPKDPIPSGILEELTIDDVRTLNPQVAIISIGSTEPHGPHLPYGTDTFQIDAVGKRAVVHANKAGARVILLPTLPISNNVNFKAFPFACRIGVLTLMNVILDIIKALEEDGIRKIVILNGHGGNPDTLQATIRQHISLHPPGQASFVCMLHIGAMLPPHVHAMIQHPSDHAGESETSRMLYLRPDLVHPDKFANFPMQTPALEHLRKYRIFFVRPWHGYLPLSAGGETKHSSAEKGKAIIEEDAKGLAGFLVELANAPINSLFPYPDHPQAPKTPAK
jgi:creatinine amidohydrolase